MHFSKHFQILNIFTQIFKYFALFFFFFWRFECLPLLSRISPVLIVIFNRKFYLKKFTFQKMSIICGQFLIFHQIYYFCVFSWFLTVTVTYFCKIPKISQSVERQFILFPRSITISVWCQIFVVRGCFLWCDFLNFGVSPNHSKYRDLQWWG